MTDHWSAPDLEFWVGGRGLLLLGVVALVLAVGFFLRYSIEQGWIGPEIRVVMAAIVGFAAVAAGERIRRVGHRTYGLWLAASGFGAIYLSVWAATALYGLLGDAVGFGLLVLVVALAATLGLARRAQAFVLLAAFGGYLAPVLLPIEAPGAPYGLGYLAVLSAGGLWAAYRDGWRYLTLVTVAGGTLMPLAGQGAPHLHGIYLAALVGGALALTRIHRWPGVAAITVGLGWTALGLGRDAWEIAGLRLSGYAALLWSTSLVGSVGVARWARDVVGDREGPGAYEIAGLFVQAAPPWLFYLFAMLGVGESRFEGSAGQIGLMLGFLIGGVYLALSYLERPGRGVAARIWKAALGYTFWLAAPAVHWSGGGLLRVWLGEAAALTFLGVVRPAVEARIAGLVALVLAVLGYTMGALAPTPTDLAFVGLPALTRLATVLGLALWTLGPHLAQGAPSWERDLRPYVLALAGLLFLWWGTTEIGYYYGRLGSGYDLARDLSISGFWLAYAAGLLATGFLGTLPSVRWAGLAMAVVAAGKVFLYDLSRLDRLYRIGSFVLLAIVLLAVSFGYQTLDRRRGSESGRG